MRALPLVFSIFLGLSYGINPEILNKLKYEASQIPKYKLSQEFQVKQIISSGRVIYASYQKPIFVGNGLDQKDQEVIVLDALEDNVDTCGEKNTHVVLIRDGIEYRVLYAYIRARGPNVFIEWERYTPRGGSSINKAYIFGHYACTKSLFTSCKTARLYQQLLYQKNAHIHDKRSQTLDFFCDLSNTQEEAMLSGAILSSLNMAVTILAGADVIYKDEVKYQKNLIHLVMEAKKTEMGRSFQIGSANTLQSIAETAANKFVDQGRVALSTGVLMFYFLVGSIGQVAEALLHMDNREIEDNPEYEEFKAEMRKDLGMKILNGLFKGSYELGDNRINPHPGYLLKETIAQIVAGKPATEVGRGFRQGGGSGNSGTRNYYTNNVRETESNRKGLRATANLNAAIQNAVGKGKDTKSAGQIFSENVRSGFHVPYGLADDGGDAIGMLLGVGTINDQDSVIDRTMDGIIGGASGALGGVVDSAADVLSPFGLGPLSKIIAGIGGGALGIAAGASCEKVCGPKQLANLGSKLFFGGKKKKPPPPEGKESVEKKFLEMYYSNPTLEIPELAMQPPMVGIQMPPMAVGVVQPQMAVAIPQPQMAVAIPQPQMAIGVPQQPQMSYGQQQPQMSYGQQQPQMSYGQQQPQMSYGQQQPQTGVGAPQQPQSGMSQPYPMGQMGQNQPGMKSTLPGPGLTSLFGDMTKEDEGVHAQGLPVRMETQLEIFSVWGWLSQDTSVIQLSTVKTESDVFVGIGTANVVTFNNDKYSAPGTYNDLIKFFILLLRIEYREELRTQIAYLIQNNYIRYDERSKVFNIVETAPILKEMNLSPEEETYLYLSFELVAFSRSYRELVDYTLLLSSPNGQRLSKTAAVVQLMTMQYLSLVFKHGDTHAVKLIRNYGLTLKTFFTKSMQDVYRYNTCWKCTSDLIGLADNTAVTIYGLLQFTLFGSWNNYLESWARQTRPDFEISVIVNWYDAYFRAKYSEIVTQVSNYVV